jgi:tRNA pseudouridine38-40 synthase
MEGDILQMQRQSRQQDKLSALQYSMNRMLRHDLQVYNLQIAPLVNKTVKGVVGHYPWHATYDAIGKLYIYRISAASVMDPLERHNRFDLSWKQSTDLGLLQRMLKQFEGTHDFRAFAAGIDVKERFADGLLDTRRTVYNIEMVDEGAGMFRIEVRIKGALYKMIRNMVGTALWRGETYPRSNF